jgi:hypothetical protein
MDVKPVSGSDPGGINFGSSGAGGTRTQSVCRFGLSPEGFYYGSNDSATTINTNVTYSSGNWHHIKLILDRTNNLYYIVFNGTLLNSEGYEAVAATPEWFSLGAGNNGINTTYYDNVNLYSTNKNIVF